MIVRPVKQLVRGAVKVPLPENLRPTPLETSCWLLARVQAATRFAQG